MPTKLIRTVQGTLSILRWDIERLRRFFRLKPGQIPFIQSIMWSSDTASRAWVGEIDGQIQPDGSKTLASGGNWPGVEHDDQFFGTAAADLSPQLTPVNMAVRRQLVIDLGPDDDWAGVFVFYFLPITGSFLGDTRALEDLANRRRMDIFDTDAAPDTRRMGKLRRMGDADPGT